MPIKKTKVKKKVLKKVIKKTSVKIKTKVKKKVLKKVIKKTSVKIKTKVKKKVLKKVANKTTISKKFKKNKTAPAAELVIKTKPEWIKNSLANKIQYKEKYSQSIKNNDEFWKKEGKRITWMKPYKKIKDVKYSKKEVRINWFQDGTLNASANCIDRHLKDKKIKLQ